MSQAIAPWPTWWLGVQFGDLEITKKFRGLSAREKQIVGYAIQGLSNKAIAEQLFITERTVKFHAERIYRKLGIRTRAELLALYIRAFEERECLDKKRSNLYLDSMAQRTI